MRQKKGISPLIATVLLVGFVIVLAVLVWIFLSGEVADITEKSTQTCTASEAAATQIEVSSCTASGSVYEINIANTGQGDVDGIRYRLIGSDDTALSVTTAWLLNAGQSSVIQANSGDINPVDRAQVIPFILNEGQVVLCDQNLVEVNCE